jgi:hypothetical protein
MIKGNHCDSPSHPAVLAALSPLYGLRYLFSNGYASFLVLGDRWLPQEISSDERRRDVRGMALERLMSAAVAGVFLCIDACFFLANLVKVARQITDANSIGFPRVRCQDYRDSPKHTPDWHFEPRLIKSGCYRSGAVFTPDD